MKSKFPGFLTLIPIILLGWTMGVVGQQYGDFVYQSDGTNVTIMGYTGPGGSVTIPSSIDGLPVTCIGGAAFANFTALKSIIIPEGVLEIGNNAFAFCTGLTNVSLPNSLQNIAHSPFYTCSSLPSIVIPPNVTNIVEFGFTYCTSLTNVVIWSSNITIGGAAFSQCSLLRSVYFMGNAPAVTWDRGVFYADDSAVVYYLPGTTGWGAAFDGLPTQLWDGLPTITAQPQSAAVEAWNPVSFTIAWFCPLTVSCQWFKGAESRSGATNDSLTISGVQPADVGGYSVVLSTTYGSVTSSIANLSINPIESGIWRGLVAYYPFDGNARDRTGYGKDGIVEGATLVADRFGVPNSAYSFNGIDNRITAVGSNHLPNGMADFTLSAWVAVDQPMSSDYRMVLSDGVIDRFQLSLGPENDSAIRMFLDLYGPGNQTLFSPVLGWNDKMWYQVLVTRTNGLVTIYRDGAPKVSQQFTTFNPNLPSLSNVTIGRRSDGGHPFKGRIDDVRIYDRALSGAEVQQLYLYESSPKSSVPPSIFIQPQGGTAAEGVGFTFGVGAFGTTPLSYQWSKDGSVLDGATNETLMLSPVNATDAGAYSVTVTNLVGVAASSSAALTVVPPITLLLTNGLVAYYPFDAAANDESGNGNSGIISNAVPSVDRFGRVNHSLFFNGTNSCVRVNPSPSIQALNAMTVSGWIKYDGMTGSPYGINIISKAAGDSSSLSWDLSIVPDGKLRPAANVGAWSYFDCNSTLQHGAWYHVAMVFDGAKLSGYVNGQMDGQLPLSGSIAPSPVPMYIGVYDPAQPVATRMPFLGNIDEVRIYNRALTADDIQKLYSYESTPPTSGPPFIVDQPQGGAVNAGTNLTLKVRAGGALPLSYQWLKDGSVLVGATDSSLTFPAIDSTNAGNYSVVVSNPLGTATSSNVAVVVYIPGTPLVRVNGALAVGSIDTVGPTTLSIDGGFAEGMIFYTLDGSVPNLGSDIYSGPITVTNSVVVRALGLDLGSFATAEAPALAVNVLPTYGLTLTTLGNGTVSANPSSGPYGSNSTVTVTAAAATDWVFDHWSGDAIGTNNPIRITMNRPLSLQAVFAQTAFPVSLAFAGGGSVTINPAQASYLSNAVVALSATASNGWSFLNWSGSATGSDNPISLVVDSPKTVSAIFGTTVGTAVLGAGSVELNSANPIPYGTVVRATAVPAPGSYFAQWAGALSGTNNPATFGVVSTNPVRVVFANLQAGQVSLALRINGDGAVSVSPRKQAYSVGDVVTITATSSGPASQFTGWTGDAVGTANPLVLTLNTSKVITANFVPIVLPPVITSALTATGLVGTAFSYQISAANLALSYGASGLPAGLNIDPASGLIAGTPENSGIYGVTLSATNSGGFGTATLMLSIDATLYPPIIVQAPSSQTVSSGSAVSFSVVASGRNPLSYQWRFNDTPVQDQTNSAYTIAGAGPANAGNYSVVVSNPDGTATSSVATLTINDTALSSIFLAATNGTSGQTNSVSINLAAQGTENAMSFSLTFDPNLLTFASAELGSGATNGSLLINTLALNNGQVGLGVSLPPAVNFAAGTQEVARINFILNPVAASVPALIGFSDQPTKRMVADATYHSQSATFLGTTIQIDPGNYLADVYPLGAPDHLIDVRDWIRVGRLVAGLETPLDPPEFQRADSAPLVTRGDAILTIADWVQAGRFAVGLDPITVTDPTRTGLGLTPKDRRKGGGTYGPVTARALRLPSYQATPGSQVEVPVWLDALGDENATGFTVSFDASALNLVALVAGSGASGATVLVNTNHAAAGQAGVALALPSGAHLANGTFELARLRFNVSSAASGTSAVTFADMPVRRQVVDPNAMNLPVDYRDGAVTLPSLPQLNVQLTGQNLVLSWSAAFTNFNVFQSSSLATTNWGAVAATPILNGNTLTVVLPITNSQSFYRLRAN